ncbi:hypothetical protein B0J15DRAFT_574424 [Fusarium solani]|uniref:Uncharacterized protein n=1 Tax=Fusarium solani TaxID=169388 RepID=A0A9P9JSV1_FUSSL|nr:uncharacterized protein B0J15DRAFT_574424 [Fusarium solani]KAH7232076.1 hypothetical protein B0J15DRAFT_574424 [Fusarium solani]
MDPERGHYPKQPYLETADGESAIQYDYARFDPPDTIKKGNSSMLEDKEKKIWKKYAGNLSTTPSTRLPGNNKLAKQKGASKGAWALWTLLKVVYRQKELMGKSVAITVQKRYPKADLTKWPLNTDWPTTDRDFIDIWDAENGTDGASQIPPLKQQDKGKKSAQTKKTGKKKTGKADANAHRSTDDRTELLNDLRNTVAGVAAEKFTIEKLVKDNVYLKNVNRILALNVSSIEWQPGVGDWLGTCLTACGLGRSSCQWSKDGNRE